MYDSLMPGFSEKEARKNCERWKEMSNHEVWKPAPGFEDNYEVSNFGRIRNSATKKVLVVTPNKKGYVVARLSVHNVKYSIKMHRAVAIAFIPNPNRKPQVNHIDGNKSNNNVGNLEWATNGENQKHAFKMGLNRVTGKAGRQKIPVAKIDTKTGGVIETYKSINDAARANNTYRQNIRKALLGTRKTVANYKWKAVMQDFG